MDPQYRTLQLAKEADRSAANYSRKKLIKTDAYKTAVGRQKQIMLQNDRERIEHERYVILFFVVRVFDLSYV